MGDSLQRERALAAGAVVGVVGAGAMGAGIAQVAAVAGHRVLLFDTRAGAAQAAVAGILAAIEKLVGKGRLTAEQMESVRGSLGAVDSLVELAPCGLVIEAIVEDLGAKQDLLRGLEHVVTADALLATNTSSISITAIGSALRGPGRLAGMHFFNPAPLMPLVEIISGAATRAAVASTVRATAVQWGKTAVHARSTPGFIVNRVARPFYAEALRVLEENAADCATIDAILREAGGFRMGAFELMDLIGNDVNYAVTRSVFDGFYGDTRFRPSLLQMELVQAGHLGRKTGRGFYDYAATAVQAQPARVAAMDVPRGLRLFGASALVERLAAANPDAERHAAHADARIASCEACVMYASDGRTATARGVANGVANTVLVDLACEFATTMRLAICASALADAGAMAAAAGLLQSCGVAVSPLEDVPGMVVLRTVAMLANEAADAVHQGVCSAGDCDLAMRKGVNYPRGPLAWADALGVAHVVAVLENLMQAYGESRYRVSPLLRRHAQTGVALIALNENVGDA